jgi:hypothetical protein
MRDRCCDWIGRFLRGGFTPQSDREHLIKTACPHRHQLPLRRHGCCEVLIAAEPPCLESPGNVRGFFCAKENRVEVRSGSKTAVGALDRHVRTALNNRHCETAQRCLFRAKSGSAADIAAFPFRAKYGLMQCNKTAGMSSTTCLSWDQNGRHIAGSCNVFK